MEVKTEKNLQAEIRPGRTREEWGNSLHLRKNKREKTEKRLADRREFEKGKPIPTVLTQELRF